MSLTEVHARLATTVILYALALALWGLWRYFRRQGVDSSYWGALVIAEILVLLQGSLGIFLWLSALRPERGGVHVLYGIISGITLPAVYIYTKGRDERREMLVYALASVFLTGIAFRAMATGGL